MSERPRRASAPAGVPATPVRPAGRQRIVLLWTIALMTPWLLASMNAEPRDSLEASGQGGSYIYTPACGTPMQVVHSEAQLRWTHRKRPTGASFVSHVDLYGSWADGESRRSDDNETESKRLVLLRAQAGVDWSILGFRLGAAGGVDWIQRNSGDPGDLGESTRDLLILPAGSVRLGPQWLHFRTDLNSGTWGLRPMELTMGIGLGSDVGDAAIESPLQVFAGWGGELIDAPADGFVYLGARIQTAELGFGLQTRFGPDGAGGGLWMALPL